MGDSPEKPKTGNVQVLERAFDLLEALAQSREPLGLSTLATQTGMSKSTVHRILATMLERDYVTNKQEFLKYLHGVRRRGWAVDCEESEANHRCLAAPIFDFSGDAIAAVGVSGSNADMPESEFETMAHSVVKAARNISLSMGYVM